MDCYLDMYKLSDIKMYDIYTFEIIFRILRFGNHDRLANPKDCQQFFSCLRTGQPRLGACPKKTVFNENTGHCDDPANVKGW